MKFNKQKVIKVLPLGGELTPPIYISDLGGFL